MSVGGKYVFATVMCLVFPMCILISCSSVLGVLMALGMFMFVKVMSSLISVMIPLLVCVLCCAYGGVVRYFWCFSFLCEFCFLYYDDVCLCVVYEFFSSSILFLMPFMLILCMMMFLYFV